MKVKIKKLNKKAQMPFKAHSDDAGFDLYATSKEYDKYQNIVYGTGLAFEIPKGYAGLVFPRSSNAKKDMVLTNCVGVIDSCYRGEVFLKFKRLLTHSTYNKLTWYDEREYEIGDRIGQIIIMPYPEIEFEEVDELTDTDRSDGGYGSTDKTS